MPYAKHDASAPLSVRYRGEWAAAHARLQLVHGAEYDVICKGYEVIETVRFDRERFVLVATGVRVQFDSVLAMRQCDASHTLKPQVGAWHAIDNVTCKPRKLEGVAWQHPYSTGAQSAERVVVRRKGEHRNPNPFRRLNVHCEPVLALLKDAFPDALCVDVIAQALDLNMRAAMRACQRLVSEQRAELVPQQTPTLERERAYRFTPTDSNA